MTNDDKGDIIATEADKCSLDDVNGGWCPGMDRCLQEANAHKKGISPLVTIDMSNGFPEKLEDAETLRGVVYRRTAHDNGVMLNYCPWCGAFINGYMTESQNGGDDEAAE